METSNRPRNVPVFSAEGWWSRSEDFLHYDLDFRGWELRLASGKNGVPYPSGFFAVDPSKDGHLRMLNSTLGHKTCPLLSGCMMLNNFYNMNFNKHCSMKQSWDKQNHTWSISSIAKTTTKGMCMHVSNAKNSFPFHMWHVRWVSRLSWYHLLRKISLSVTSTGRIDSRTLSPCLWVMWKLQSKKSMTISLWYKCLKVGLNKNPSMSCHNMFVLSTKLKYLMNLLPSGNLFGIGRMTNRCKPFSKPMACRCRPFLSSVMHLKPTYRTGWMPLPLPKPHPHQAWMALRSKSWNSCLKA